MKTTAVIKDEIHKLVTALVEITYDKGLEDGAELAINEFKNAAPKGVESRAKAAKTKPPKAKPKARPRKAAKAKTKAMTDPDYVPKTGVVKEAAIRLFNEHGQATKDEILAAANAVDGREITKHDVANAMSWMTRRNGVQLVDGAYHAVDIMPNGADVPA